MRRFPILVLLLAMLAACGGGTEDDDAARTAGAGPPRGVEIEGTTLDGDRLALADFRGKPTFVNVWASW